MHHFNRWKSHEDSTWAYQVFNLYSLELGKQIQAHYSAIKKVYKTLGKEGAEWKDDVKKHLDFSPPKKAGIFSDLKDWSAAVNNFDNWINLNSIVFSSSNLETYMVTVIRLALESDPGLIFGESKILDGTLILKHQKLYDYDFGDEIENCTKGDWQSRVAGYGKLFGELPNQITNNLGELEKIRNLRNNVAHAIGRDIEDSRKHGVKQVLPIEKISDSLTNKYRSLIQDVAKAIDEHLLEKHVGEYQLIYFYHTLYPSLDHAVNPSIRASYFKKTIGSLGALPPSKDLCKELVLYYETI